MKLELRKFFGLIFLITILVACTNTSDESKYNRVKKVKIEKTDPLPSWNEGATKSAILSYVKDVTDAKSANYIEVKDRIATFDNDGTLWSEQPMYFQLFFAFDRVNDLVDEHPEWISQEPFKSVLSNDVPGLMKQGMEGLFKIIMATHTGLTEEEFNKVVMDWLSAEKHPIKKKAYTELVYQPMLELVNYLQENEFKTFIVSGGGIDFMRPWTEEIYGIAKDHVIGSSLKVKYDYNNGNPVVRKMPELDFMDDKEGKPEAIQKFIGRKPVFAVGNSDGDLQMLRWTDSNSLKSFKLYVHHTDSIREWAYDRNSHIGTFNVGLDEANEKAWVIANMASDWKVIYPFELN